VYCVDLCCKISSTRTKKFGQNVLIMVWGGNLGFFYHSSNIGILIVGVECCAMLE
jgi:hypothetical protein